MLQYLTRWSTDSQRSVLEVVRSEALAKRAEALLSMGFTELVRDVEVEHLARLYRQYKDSLRTPFLFCFSGRKLMRLDLFAGLLVIRFERQERIGSDRMS